MFQMKATRLATRTRNLTGTRLRFRICGIVQIFQLAIREGWYLVWMVARALSKPRPCKKKDPDFN